MMKKLFFNQNTHMKRWLYGFVLVLSFGMGQTGNVSAQCPTGAVCDTLSTSIDSDRNFTTLSAFPSSCAGSLTVSIPAGNWVDSVSTSYDVTAIGSAWMSEQRSLLYCTNTATGEGQLSSGSGTTTGTFGYSRSGLNFANTATGNVTIELHLGRTFGGTGCDATFNFVDAGTWNVIVYYSPTPSCLPPSSPAISNLTSNGLTVNWTAAPTAVDYDYEVRTSGAAGSGPAGLVTSGNVTADSAVITGLSPSTTYDLYLRTNCSGTNGTSPWTSGVNFTTPIQGPVGVNCITGLPGPVYTEDFEVQGGWTGITGGSGNWGYNSGGTGSTGTGPLGAHSGSSYVYYEASGGAPQATMVSPAIDLTTGNDSAELSFWIHGFGADIGTLTVGVSNSATGPFTQIFTSTGAIQAAQGDPWQNVGVRLDNYVGQTIYLEFDYVDGGTGFTGDMAVDLIEVVTCVTCPNPSALSLVSATPTSIDVSWLASTSQFEVTWDTVGFVPGTSTNSLSVSNTNATITGLSPNTGYDIYVRSDCSASSNGFSGWVGPVTARTLCTIFTAPFTENFDGTNWTSGSGFNNTGSTIDPCWNLTFVAGGFSDFAWGPRGSAPTGNNGPTAAVSAPNFLYAEASGGSTGDTTTITSPLIDVSGLTVPALYFEQHRSANFGTVPDMDVEVSNDFGATWTNEYAVTGTIQTAAGDPWSLELVNLAAYAGDTILVRMTQTKTGFEDAAIDNFEVKEAPTCPWPTGQSIVGLTDTTATLGWSDPTGSNWDIEWGPIGFTQGTGSVTSVTNDTVTFGPLSPNTCYDIYVRTNCTSSSNGVSIWRGPIEFCTQCAPFTAPYTQNFDGTTAPELDNCWTPLAFNANSTNYELQTDAFRNLSAPNSMELHNSSTTATLLGIASPRFSDLDTNKRIEFQVYDEDGQFDGSDLIIGVMTDLSDETTFEAVDTIFEADMPNDVWDFKVVDLTGHSVNNGGHVVFKHGMNSTFDNIHVDDFSYDEIPSCQAPLVNTLGVTGLSTAQGFATWGNGSQGVKTYYAWGVPGFVPQQSGQLGLDSVPGSVDQGLMTGFSPQTTYEFYVQDSCVGSGLSPWIGPFTFTTPCTVSSMPYYESFDTWALACWDSTGGNAFWQPNNSAAPDQYARADFWSNSTGVYHLTSRPVSITGDAQIRFDWSHLYSTVYPDDELQVLVKTLSAANWDTVLSLKGPNDFNDPTAGNFNSPGQFITEEIILDPNLYTGDTIQVKLIGISDWGPDLFLNDFYVELAPTCPKLINVAATGITSSSATLNWNASNNAVNYEVWYGPQGFFQGTLTTGGTRQFVTPDSLNVSNLTPQTCYEYLVRAVCSPGDTSQWVGPEVFCTPCAPFTAPYFEDFDAVAVGVSGDFGNCWNGFPAVGTGFPQSYGWESSAGPTPAFGSGPDQDVSGSGNFLFTRSSAGATDDLAELYSPTVNITTLASPEIRFSYHMAGANIDTLHMDVNDGTGWTNDVLTLGGSQQNATTDPWLDTAVSLASFSAATNVQVRFRVFKGPGFGGGDVAIDEFFIDDPLTCFRPDSVQLTSRTQTSITLDWQTGGASNWQVYYDTAGATLAGGGGTLVPVSSKPFTITGLNPGTLYQVWVRDSCGPGDVSFWKGPLGVFTDCPNLAPLNLPYTQDFENLSGTYQSAVQLCDGSFSSLDFSNTDPSGRLRFEAGPGFYNGGSRAATLDRDPSGGVQINYLILTMDMSNYIGNNAVLMDFYFMHHGEESHPNDRVWIRGSQADTWIELYDTYANRGSTGIYNYVDSLDLSGILAANSQSFSSSFQMRMGQEDNFPATSTTISDGFTFDDITLYDTTSTPACVDPTALSHNTVRCDSVEVSWNSSGATVSSVLEYGPTGFTPGAGTIINNAVSPQLIAGLSANTDYDVYVVDICATDTSGAAIYTFNTGTVGAPVANYTSTIQPATLTGRTVDFDATTTTGTGVTYAWDFGDGNSGTGATTSHTYAANGTYDACVIVTNVCAVDTFCQQLVIEDIGIVENALGQSLNVFPNPATDVINVSFATVNSGDVNLRLLDAQGRVVMTKAEKANGDNYTSTLSVKALSRGMYILEVQSGDLKARRSISVR